MKTSELNQIAGSPVRHTAIIKDREHSSYPICMAGMFVVYMGILILTGLMLLWSV